MYRRSNLPSGTARYCSLTVAGVEPRDSLHTQARNFVASSAPGSAPAGRSAPYCCSRRNRGRQRDLELDDGGDYAFLLQAVEQSKRFDRQVGHSRSRLSSIFPCCWKPAWCLGLGAVAGPEGIRPAIPQLWPTLSNEVRLRDGPPPRCRRHAAFAQPRRSRPLHC
jgi:hypothetical protein